MTEKKWQILNKELRIKPFDNAQGKNHELRIEDIVEIILKNRGITTKKEINAFFNTDISSVTTQTVGIDARQLTKALKRIQTAMENKEQIVVFGDYDVDGITGTAILWETLHAIGALVIPYIPSRMEEGYGLSVKGIENLTTEVSNVKLIITVDNGIVANEAVSFANKKGIDIIITDHHTPPAGGGKKLPDAHSIVHTTALCGAGVAYLLAQEITNYKSQISNKSKIQNPKYQIPKDHLSLVALATVADLVPLTGANRVLLRFGLEELHKTTRPGLLALFKESDIEKENIGVYEIGHIIGPRLNAMGRLESAMDSLRLLCTKDRVRAMVLADTLSRTNKERQLLTQTAATHAINKFKNQSSKVKSKLLFIAHEEYEEGIIGLVAGKLVEEFYLPAVVLSIGKLHSKASARSIAGFNIIEFIRTSSDLLVNAGGHPMAAGFTIETQKIDILQKALEKLAEKQLEGEILQRVLKIDCEIPLTLVNDKLYQSLQKLSPFGMGNSEPTFMSKVVVKDIKMVGREKSHLKLRVQGLENREKAIGTIFESIAFGQSEKGSKLNPGDKINIVYTISENEWNERKTLQLKIRDIKIN